MEKRQIPDGLHDKRKKKRAAAAVLAVVLVLLVIVIGAAIGKYQRQLQSDNSVKAKDFYFTSNLLDGTSHTLAPESTTITFTLSNHADNLRYSEVDIEYSVTVKYADGTDAGVTINPANGTLAAGKTATADANVTISGLQAGNTYTVTATGTGGYSETLTATIVVPSKTGALYYYQEPSADGYTLLTVWNEGEQEGTVTIGYKGIPDNTNPNMTTWKTNEGDLEVTQNVEIAAHESKVFRFFGETTINVTGATSKELQ